MAAIDMSMVLGGVVIPYPSSFVLNVIPNETDVRVLSGNLYTDFVSNLRTWEIGWDTMTRENYEIIYQIYLNQYSRLQYPILQFDAKGIYVPVKVNIDPENLKHNGVLVVGFKMTLKEQYPFS